MSSSGSKLRPIPDQVLIDIANYVNDYQVTSGDAYQMARYCLMDGLGCALEALQFPECAKLLGPYFPGISFEHGARVPGTRFELDPLSAAFNIGTMIRWLDFNDAFSGAADGGHPSDNLSSILAIADHLSRKRLAEGKPGLVMREVLTAMIKSYEIHGLLALENDLSQLGFDYVALAKVAATAVVTQMLGGDHEQIVNAVSNAWADGVNLKIYRQGTNTGPRKSWAAGDANSRAVWLGLLALKGEMGYPWVLTAKTYGFYDAVYRGNSFKFSYPYGCSIVQNVIFKLVPSGLHGQSAAECAFILHPIVKDRIDDIDTITVRTQKKLLRIMDKKGPLTNPADRDHCVQYVIAVALIQGKLDTADYQDEFAADPRIDRLREKMTVVEEPRYTRDRLDPEKRSNAIAIEVTFKDGSRAPKIEIEYPLGHPRRRAEAMPALQTKFEKHLARCFSHEQQLSILDVCRSQEKFEATGVSEFMGRFAI